jgi:hypothetical protein
MIGKVVRGSHAGGLLRYLYGPGRANEHIDPHLVAGFGDPAELEPECRLDGTPDLRRLAALLAQPLAALGWTGYDKPVWHCSVRAAPGDRVLSDIEWAGVATEIMHRTGLAPKGDEAGVRWVAVRHADDHIHIVATLARQDGTRPRFWNDFYRVRGACRSAEEQLGLRATPPADRTAARRPSRAETEHAARRGWDEPPRVTLRRHVCGAAAGARTEREFFDQLASAGVLVRRRYSAQHPGKVSGYAVGLPHHRDHDGGVIWYGGGKLAADLTLPKLRGRWEPRSRSAERSVGHVPRVGAGTGRLAADGLTVGERELIYGHAARQAAHAAEHIRHCAGRDPGRAADAAWAAADALHAAARVTSSGAFRCAADAYDRAARAPFGRLPPCTSAGNRLRAAARTLALMGQPDSDAYLAALALIGNLVALTLAVAELRQAQQQAVRAAAARTAAEHLRAAAAELRSRAPRFGQTDVRRRPRRWSPADLARYEAAALPLLGRAGPIHPAPAGTGPAAPRPRRTVRPPVRAGPHR